MINFRYHIVSLMAVFIALAVGIAVGVSLSPSVSEGLQQQAVQDRQTVTDLRTELTRRQALDDYRNAYDLRVGKIVTAGALANTRVALVAMPDAPNAVVQSITTAVEDAGGTVVRNVKINNSTFDTTNAVDVSKALEPYATELQLTDDMSQPTKIGRALARSVTDRGSPSRDEEAVKIGQALTDTGLLTLSRGDEAEQAELAIIVTAVATSTPPTPEVLAAHLQLDMAIKGSAAVVLAGPNSNEIDGTDVLAARTDSTASDALSTVDVADLSSGVTTVVLTGKEQLNGTVGQHYGALSRADAPLPELPVR